MFGETVQVTIDGIDYSATVGNYYDGILCFYVKELHNYFRLYDMREDHDIYISVEGFGDLHRLSYTELQKHQPFIFYKCDYGMFLTEMPPKTS